MSESKQHKKLNILMILDVLKEHTDENHKLLQKEIEDMVAKKFFPLTIRRRAVKSNLDCLIEAGYGIEYTKPDRKNGEPGGWYLAREITDAELHLLIDGLLFSKYIPYSQCKALIGKLEGLSSKHFRSRHDLPENQPENKSLFLTIEILNEAIKKGKRVAFQFIYYGTDKKPQTVTNKDGTPHIYRVSPYEIVVTNGRYYLICAHSKGTGLFNYRLDYIHEIALLENENRRPIKEMANCRGGRLDLSAYMREHIYMYGGESRRVTFRADLRVNANIVGHIIDWFGKDVRFSEIAEDAITATVSVNEQAMLYWALQYGMAVEILKPIELREKVREAVASMWEKYK